MQKKYRCLRCDMSGTLNQVLIHMGLHHVEVTGERELIKRQTEMMRDYGTRLLAQSEKPTAKQQ